MNALRRFFMRSGAAIGVAVFVGAGAGNAQAVSVTPDGGNLTATSGVATFVITNNLNIDETFDLFCGGGGAVTGCEAPPAVQVQRGGSVSVDVTYSTGAGASGTLSLSAAGEISGESDDGWYDVTVGSPGVAVTPDGATAPTRLANTSGYSETFTVTNTGPDPMTFSFVCGGAGGVFCGTVPSPVNLSAFGVDGYVTTVSMPYSVGGPGTGTLTLTASGGGVSDPGSYTVLIATYGVSVIPDGGTAPTRTANTGGYSESFTVTNTGSTSNTFSFTCTGSAGVTCGTVPSPVPLANGAQAPLSMPYSVGAPGTGTLTLTASGTNTSDPGSFSVPIVSYGVTVTPDGNTTATRTANTGGYSETFTVTNMGSGQNPFSFSCSGATGVTCGAIPGPVTLAANGVTGYQTTVGMPYSVGAPGTSTLTLTANGTNASDPGSFSVPIVSFGVTVTPDGGTAATRTPNTGGYSESFTVTNTGSGSNTFSFSCSGAGGVTCGTVPSPIPLASGAQQAVSMPYSVGAAGTGTLTLTASGTNASDPGSFSVPIVSYGVTVTPDGGTAATRTANTGGYSESFTVTNTGSSSNTFSFSCSGAGGVTCGTVPSTIPLASGAQQAVSMPYSVGAPGTGTLTLTASGTNASDPGSFSVPIVSYGVSVTPDGGTASHRPQNTGGYTESFTVTNSGSASNTFGFTCAGTGGVTCGTVPSTIPLASGAQQAVSMPYSVGAPGTGTLTLTASGTNASDPGSFSVPIVSYGVSVTPDGGTASHRPQNTGGYTESFTVTNSGSASNTFGFTCAGTGGVT